MADKDFSKHSLMSEFNDLGTEFVPPSDPHRGALAWEPTELAAFHK